LWGMVSSSGTRGVVVELYPSGTSPAGRERHSLARFARTCSAAEVVVATTSPASALEDVPRRFDAEYPSAAALRDAGAVHLGDALVETATAKLMWALAQSTDTRAVCALMGRSLAHELAQGDRASYVVG